MKATIFCPVQIEISREGLNDPTVFEDVAGSIQNTRAFDMGQDWCYHFRPDKITLAQVKRAFRHVLKNQKLGKKKQEKNGHPVVRN